MNTKKKQTEENTKKLLALYGTQKGKTATKKELEELAKKLFS